MGGGAAAAAGQRQRRQRVVLPLDRTGGGLTERDLTLHRLPLPSGSAPATPPSGARPLSMTDANGTRFVCFVPDGTRGSGGVVVSPAACADCTARGRRTGLCCSRSPPPTPAQASDAGSVPAAKTPGQLLDGLGDSFCTFRVEDWWTYELCYKKSIRQYHVDAGGGAAAPGGGAYTLGTFDAARSDANAVHVDPSDVSGEAKYVRQVYAGGTPCDLNGRPRETEVRGRREPGVTRSAEPGEARSAEPGVWPAAPSRGLTPPCPALPRPALTTPRPALLRAPPTPRLPAGPVRVQPRQRQRDDVPEGAALVLLRHHGGHPPALQAPRLPGAARGGKGNHLLQRGRRGTGRSRVGRRRRAGRSWRRGGRERCGEGQVRPGSLLLLRAPQYLAAC